MSFSGFNFEETVKSYLLNYFDPAGSLRDSAAVKDLELEVKAENSIGLDKFYVKNFALSFFFRSDILGATAQSQINKDCAGSTRYIHHHESDHDFFHPESGGYGTHTHIIKQPLQMISTKELKCMLDQIQAYQNNLETCDEKTNECYNPFQKTNTALLNDKDYENIVNEYRKFLQQENKNFKSVKLHYDIDQTYAKVMGLGKNGLTSFINAFVFTLLEEYVKREMISRGMQKNLADLIVRVLESGLAAVMSNTAPNALAVNVLNLVTSLISKQLELAGLPTRSTKLVTINLMAIASVISNPFSLVEMGISGLGAAAGQALALKAIEYLPVSLKTSVNNTVSTTEPERTINIDAAVAANNNQQSGPHRRRGFGR